MRRGTSQLPGSSVAGASQSFSCNIRLAAGEGHTAALVRVPSIGGAPDKISPLSDRKPGIARGKIPVAAVGDVDEAMAILTGVETGVPDEDGTYPEVSVHGRVRRRLAVLARLRLAYTASVATAWKRKAGRKRRKARRPGHC
jgi:hypothetical protein